MKPSIPHYLKTLKTLGAIQHYAKIGKKWHVVFKDGSKAAVVLKDVEEARGYMASVGISVC